MPHVQNSSLSSTKAEDQRPRADQGRPDREVEPRPVHVGEPPEAGSQHDQDDARRNVEETRLEGREADELEVDREEDEEPVQAGVDEERLDVGRGEVARAEEREREHRVRDALLDDHERGERGDGDDEGPPDGAEAAVGALDEAVGEEPEARGRERGTWEVEAARALRGGVIPAAGEREEDRGGGERQVQEEDPAPRDPLDERPAGRRAEDRCDARERGPEPDRVPRVLAVGGPEERERVRGQERARDALERPRDDQDGLVRRRPGEERGEREAARARDEDAPPAVAVADRAADEVEGRERERVGEEDPLLARSGRGRGPPRSSEGRR